MQESDFIGIELVVRRKNAIVHWPNIKKFEENQG